MKATVLLALLVLGILVAPFRTDAQPAGESLPDRSAQCGFAQP